MILGAAVRPDGRPSGTLRARVDAAWRFGGPGALYIPTGAKGRHGPAEAAVMRERLVSHGVPADRVILEDTGTDTLSSIRAVRRLLLQLGPRGPVHLASSFYHLPRCLILARLAGLHAHACPPPPVPGTTSQWQRWYWRLREIPALPYDALLMIVLRLTGRL